MEKGILICAYGHPYYGRLAFNLSATIKAVEPTMPIAVLATHRGIHHVSEIQRRVFDQIIYLPDGNEEGFGAKLHLADFTPFKATIFLDADMLWLPKKTPTMLFNELEGAEFTGITEGWYDIATGDRSNANDKYYFWAEPDEIKKVYRLKQGKIFQWRSEFLYFKNTPKVQRFFKRAQAIHKEPGVTVQRHFASHVPDELGINISAAINGIEPHQPKWSPAYWHKLHKDVLPQPASLFSNWYLISFGSNHASGSIKRIYNDITRAALNKLGLQHVFILHSKKEFMQSRQKI